MICEQSLSVSQAAEWLGKYYKQQFHEYLTYLTKLNSWLPYNSLTTLCCLCHSECSELHKPGLAGTFHWKHCILKRVYMTATRTAHWLEGTETDHSCVQPKNTFLIDQVFIVETLARPFTLFRRLLCLSISFLGAMEHRLSNFQTIIMDNTAWQRSNVIG